MNKDNAHLYLPLVKALAEGKTIQYLFSPHDDMWLDTLSPSFRCPPECYRIKSEPREVWINCYLDGSFGAVYKSKEAAYRGGRDEFGFTPVKFREVVG